MNKLVELSHASGPRYQTEEQRLAFIAGDRARELLALASHDQDASGCTVADLEHAAPVRGVVYLVGQLIKSGEATVIRDGSTRAETSVTVHDYNGSTGGSESFESADGEFFLGYPTWVS